jgi:putative peptide zinc metalloprotease protein
VGELVNPDTLRLTAVVSQEQADRLFERDLADTQLRLQGQPHLALAPDSLRLVPYERDRLISPVLGWLAGGAVPVRPDDPQGLATVDSYFELQASFSARDSGLLALHGMTGWLRVPLPASTLAQQAERMLRQFVQKRYSL